MNSTDLPASKSDRQSPPFVEATVNYLRPMTERPWSDVVNLAKRNFDVVSTPVKVENAWRIAGNLSLEKEGFIAMKHKTAVTDFRDVEQLKTIYAREMEEVVKKLVGADRALIMETPLTRFSGQAGAIQPGHTAHMDFTFGGLADRMLERGMDLKAPEFRDYGRICVYQTWRAFSGPGQDSTLAFTDGRTVAAEDLVEADFIRYQENAKPGYNQFYLCNPNAQHRWYFFPRLESDDLLVWTGIDLKDQTMRPVHSAIKTPTETNAPPRNSVETRVYTFFKS